MFLFRTCHNIIIHLEAPKPHLNWGLNNGLGIAVQEWVHSLTIPWPETIVVVSERWHQYVTMWWSRCYGNEGNQPTTKNLPITPWYPKTYLTYPTSHTTPQTNTFPLHQTTWPQISALRTVGGLVRGLAHRTDNTEWLSISSYGSSSVLRYISPKLLTCYG